jgi:hypothetical protein
MDSFGNFGRGQCRNKDAAMPESQSSSKHKPTPLFWLGLVVSVSGATMTVSLIVGQFRKSTPLMHKGDQVYINGQYAGTVAQDELRDDGKSKHYGLIGGSVLIAIVGIAVMALARHRSSPQGAEPPGRMPGAKWNIQADDGDPGSS